ncbi:MAG: ABC transporter substrate-binding protein [Betaproteobacteria bacterium]|nr:ABC transporter substrate-binding protein [Betaproteobacteria bacterium]
MAAISDKPLRDVTLALGLRSTAQSLGVIGRDLGVFERHGLALRIVREETAGPDGARGLLSGEFQFAEFGSVPVIQAAIEGHDPLILLAAEPVSALYILAGRGIASPENLAGGAIGVLSAAGQTGFSAQKMLERWGLSGRVRLQPLGTYPGIYQALAAGEIHGGVLTADYRLAGEIAHGFVQLADLGEAFRFQGPVLATTRRLRASDPDLIAALVRAYVESIRVFKTAADRVVPVLQRHLGFVDALQAAAIQSFYAARFSNFPLASDDGIARVIASFAATHPQALALRPADVHDASFVRAAAGA